MSETSDFDNLIRPEDTRIREALERFDLAREAAARENAPRPLEEDLADLEQLARKRLDRDG